MGSRTTAARSRGTEPSSSTVSTQPKSPVRAQSAGSRGADCPGRAGRPAAPKRSRARHRRDSAAVGAPSSRPSPRRTNARPRPPVRGVRGATAASGRPRAPRERGRVRPGNHRGDPAASATAATSSRRVCSSRASRGVCMSGALLRADGSARAAAPHCDQARDGGPATILLALQPSQVDRRDRQ